MGVVQLDAYVLIMRGKDCLTFIDGLSTNKVTSTCTTVFTNSAAKIIDMVDVIDGDGYVALIGHNPYKNDIVQHISTRILNQDISISDASSNNSVYLSTSDIDVPDSVTKCSTFRGMLLVAPKNQPIDITMTEADFSEYRVENMIPHQGFEITPKHHPLACGLGHLVHEAKGCYIGQEILARMRSRGRQGRKLVKLPNPVNDATTIGSTHSLAIVRSDVVK
tara:strand:+ start:2353 stop:3015 length:663 start_codon:yes stop_codon:yes gene_type:complete